MKQYVSLFILMNSIFMATLLPYSATKNGIVVEATDLARNPHQLCLQAEVSEQVKHWIGSGFSVDEFLSGNMRPVKVTITNTTNQPVMLASYYGLKVINGLAIIDVMIMKKMEADYTKFGALTGVMAYLTLASLVVSIGFRDEEDGYIGKVMSLICGAGLLGSIGGLVFLQYLHGQFKQAMTDKFEELNHKDEALILPGQTIQKLLISQKDSYISRFPIVIYSLENREDMIVFDVDLRA